MMKQIVCILAAACCAVAFSASPASAVPIIFIHDGVGSGSLAGVPFAATPFTITAIGDTSNRLSIMAGVFAIPHDAVTIDIAGVGMMTFLDGTRTFVVNAVEGVGFSSASGPDLFDGPFDPAFATWDMLSSVGPVSGNGALMQWGSGVQTNLGLLAFDNDVDFDDFSKWDVPTTFQAIVASVAPVPVPGAALLGVLGVALTARLRRRGSI